MAAPELGRLLATAEPRSDFVTHTFPTNRRRRYERLERFPEGFLVLGDGLCSFHPIYGQGMSVAACEAQALGECLAEEGPTLAASADLAVDGVTGRKPPGFRVVTWYMNRLQNLAARDVEVCRGFFQVSNLLAGPESLFAPRIALRVLAPGGGRRPAAAS